MAIQIPILACTVNDTTAQNILLAEPVHLRLIEAHAEIDHSCGSVVIFAVPAETACYFAYLLTERSVGFGCDLRASQKSRLRDLTDHAASAVIDVLSSGIAGACGNALQTIGVIDHFVIFGSTDDHTLTVEYIPGDPLVGLLQFSKKPRYNCVIDFFLRFLHEKRIMYKKYSIIKQPTERKKTDMGYP